MKIRLGYISNSSSSSFIILQEDYNKCKSWQKKVIDKLFNKVNGIKYLYYIFDGFSEDTPTVDDVEIYDERLQQALKNKQQIYWLITDDHKIESVYENILDSLNITYIKEY